MLNQRGSASVAIAGLLFSLLAIAAVGVAAIGIVITKHKLDSSVDLTALSAAYQLPMVSAACDIASAQLAQDGFALVACQGADDWVTLTAEAKIAFLAYPIRLRTEATAGW